MAQVAFERGWLQGGLNDAGGVIGIRGETEGGQSDAEKENFPMAHMRWIRNEKLEKSKKV
jgi:hypothetical protein